jgi:hypothetical protein
MTTTLPRDDRMLGLYLNDHLAGATAGTELAKRLAGENKDRPGSEALAGLADDVRADRDALLAVMATLDVPVRRYKEALGWVGEKVGRLKPNGRVLSRSPLSQVIELEAMLLGIEGKSALWRTLRARAAADSRLTAGNLDILIERAREQAELVESLRVLAAAEAVGGDASESATEPPREQT